jgi:HAD superfamily hydrolase (TIGR01509 family)
MGKREEGKGERALEAPLPFPFRLSPFPALFPFMTAAILFDFNGVIVDDEPQHCDALIATLAEYGHTLDRETYYAEYLGFDDRECFRFTFRQMGQSDDEASIAAAIKRKSSHYERAIHDSLRLVPGAEEFIESAALDGFQLAIVSGALRREIEMVLDLAGLQPHFAEIVAAEDVTACKPDPQGYHRARQALALPPQRCVVVEDSLPGLAAARAAGLRCAMLSTSHAEEAIGKADLVWRDFLGHTPADLPWAHA